MTYLIDGHNLIPYVPGLSLADLDDEQELIKLLSAFSQARRCQIEVYFDKGQAGRNRETTLSRMKVHFTLPPVKADDALITRLLGIGRAARNYTVVTSDREVQSRARQLGAALMSSHEFTGLLTNVISKKKTQNSIKKEKENDIDSWLELFSKGKEED